MSIGPGGDRPGSDRGALAALPPDYQPETGPVQLPPQFRRTVIDLRTKEPAGTIIIDTPNTYLYLVLGNGKAMRYGIGVGREGFTWAGTERISRMAEWPDWHPPKEMAERKPEVLRDLVEPERDRSDQLAALPGPGIATAGEDPRRPDAIIVVGSAHYGSVAVAGQRDRVALVGGPNRAGADQLGALLAPDATAAGEDPRRPHI